MSTGSTWWCESAWLGGEVAEPGVVIEVADGRIAAVADSVAEPPPGAVRLAGLTLPGLANAHSHAFHRALRGRTQAGTGSFWTWRDQMYGVAQRLDPDSCFRLARAVYAEMAMAGISVVGEFHYVHHQPDGTPYAEPNAMGEALLAAAATRRRVSTSAGSATGRRSPGLSGSMRWGPDRRPASAPLSIPFGRSTPQPSPRSPPGPTAAAPRSTSTSPSSRPRTRSAPPSTVSRPPNCSQTWVW